MLPPMAFGRDATIALLALGAALATASGRPAATSPGPPTIAPGDPSAAVLRSAVLDARPARLRLPMRGVDFPDRVLALTWDDGPDAHTLELARFLHEAHVSATFFVVGSWHEGLSEEPGVGATKLATGYDHQPILAELARLGHRVAHHTKNHVLLGHVRGDRLRDQLAPLPLPGDRVEMFRAPGGFWTPESAVAFEDAADGAALAKLVGPIHWDIDAKDWECSLYCRSDAPATECEPGPIPGERRVRPETVARRYLARIEEAKRGIVLLHDRVGDVGSTYALDVARALVPELVRRRYVFAAPVLGFGAPVTVTAPPPRGTHTADLNGDGRDDRCEATDEGIACALASPDGFEPPTSWWTGRLSEFTLADVNGDGRADLCADRRCRLAP